MWKQKTEPPTARELQTLKAVRRQTAIVRNARKKCNEIVSSHRSVRAPTLDGMPKGSKLPCGLDGSTTKAETLLNVLKREEKKLRQYRTAAQKIINRFPPTLYGFCMYYYMECMSVQDTASLIDRSERLCWSYKAFVEQAGKAPAAGGNGKDRDTP